MIPTSILIVATSFLFILPVHNSTGTAAKRGNDVKTYSTMSVNLHLSTAHKKNNETPGSDLKPESKAQVKNLSLPPEKFQEATLELESWMKSPKTWNKQ
jgi:hypothetical protein